LRGKIIRRFLIKVLRKAIRLIAKTFPKLPAILEIELQHVQGKGSGSNTTEIEAKIALDFIPMSNTNKIVVLDIGANIGSYSEAIKRLAPQANVFAFEPSSIARKNLEDRFMGDSSVTIVPFALGSKISTETLWSDTPGSVLSSLTKRRLDHFGTDFNQTESIEVVTLDSWARSTNVIPSLIKIDVEGHELDVLKGGLKTFTLAQVIQFEFGGCNIDTRTFFKDFWYLLTEAGFRVYRISEGGPIRISYYSEQDECFRTTNYLAVKK
jgi:FkbM family methyltransferase